MNEITREFLEFARSKPADETYDYWDSENCALAQFGKKKYGALADGGGSRNLYLVDPETESVSSVEVFNSDYYADRLEGYDSAVSPVRAEPWTWGDVVRRTEAYIQRAEAANA